MKYVATFHLNNKTKYTFFMVRDCYDTALAFSFEDDIVLELSKNGF